MRRPDARAAAIVPSLQRLSLSCRRWPAAACGKVVSRPAYGRLRPAWATIHLCAADRWLRWPGRASVGASPAKEGAPRMASLTLYYGSGSPHAWRARYALGHKGIPYDMKTLSFDKEENKRPGFLKLKPRGQVPVIGDDGFALYA